MGEADSWKTRYGRHLRSALAYSLQVLIVMVLIIHFVGRVSIVQGGSMEPGIVTGERIIVNLLIYNFGLPKRGDVVVFKNPRDTSKDYIKRVIGLPGETVEIRQGATYVDGRKLDESYVTLHDYSDTPPVHIADSCVWVMGDNRANSEDSRRWGQLPLVLIRGKASLVLWPPERVALFP
jgi:signal peptidase I